MRIAVDTNVILRSVLADDAVQHGIAIDAMARAEKVIIPIVALCETVWVLTRTYRLPREDIAAMVRAVIDVENTEYDVELVEAGLTTLDAGGDFADGVIARQGLFKRADAFVSFDRNAIRLLNAAGIPAREPHTS